MSEQGSGASSDRPDDLGSDIGSVTQEATKLLGAVADWARDHGSDLGAGVAALADQAAASAHDIGDHIATDDPECRYCPVCRTVHAVRAASPEVRAQLTTAASSFLRAAAGMLAASQGTTAKPPVQRIDLDGLDDDPAEDGLDDLDDLDDEDLR